MINNIFQINLQNLFNTARSLVEVENILINQANKVKRDGKRLGIVVGKITPTEGETLSLNKIKLAQNTEIISDLVKNRGIVVFSSAAIPDSMENIYPAVEFYDIFNRFISNHVDVLITTEGWKQSVGATEEVEKAKKRNLIIFHFQNGQLNKEYNQ